MRTIGESFDPRRNSLNALRLALAVTVVVSHSITLGGFGTDYVGPFSPANAAVDGFFGISGFLIADSARAHGVFRYLWMRVLRIMPAFWVCLVVVAFGFGIVGWLHDQSALHGYFASPLGPFRYIVVNSLLHMHQTQIAGTPAHVPHPLVWDGSLWTLQWEFLCYLGMAALAIIGALQRRAVVLVLACFAWLIELGLSLHPIGYDTEIALRFAPIFLTGAVLRLYGDRIPDSGWLAGVAALLFVSGSALNRNPDLIAGPALTYLLIWLGVHLPLHRVGARNDFSYGIYIYAYAGGQLLAIWHFQRFGYAAFTVTSLALTAPLAMASWFVVERHALRLKRWTPRRVRLASTG